MPQSNNRFFRESVHDDQVSYAYCGIRFECGLQIMAGLIIDLAQAKSAQMKVIKILVPLGVCGPIDPQRFMAT